MRPNQNATDIDDNLKKVVEACLSAPYTPSAGLAVKPSAVQPSTTIEFDSGGHFFIGNAVELSFIGGKVAGDAPLLANGLSFGDLLRFWATSTHVPPISNGDALKQCHLDSINAIEKLESSKVNNIHDAYKLWKCGDEKLMDDHKFEKIVTANTLGSIDMVLLAINNPDHFGSDAEKAFGVLFMEAVRTAEAARNAQSADEKKRLLTGAYVLCAFGGHYFTDRFAAGHMRTP